MAKFSKGNPHPLTPSCHQLPKKVQKGPLHGALQLEKKAHECPSQQPLQEEISCTQHAD